MVNRLGVLSRLLTPSNPATFCSTMVPETGRFQFDQRAGMRGIAAQNADAVFGGFDIDFGFVFGVLGDFEIFGRDRAAVVEHLGAIESFVRERLRRPSLSGSRRTLRRDRDWKSRAGSGPFSTVSPSLTLRSTTRPAAERGDVDGAVHVGRDGAVRGDLRREGASSAFAVLKSSG